MRALIQPPGPLVVFFREGPFLAVRDDLDSMTFVPCGN
jgi:hypothetical protein